MENPITSILKTPMGRLSFGVAIGILVATAIVAVFPDSFRVRLRSSLALVSAFFALGIIVVSLIMMIKSSLKGRSVVEGIQWYLGIATGGILLTQNWMFFALLLGVFLLVLLFENRISPDPREEEPSSEDKKDDPEKEKDSAKEESDSKKD